MEQNRLEEKTIIEKALSRGQKVSFSVEEAPAKIELSLGGARDKHPEGTGAKPAKLSIYNLICIAIRLCLASIYIFPLTSMEL